MIYVHFIVNPISGTGKHNLSAIYIRNHFPNSKFRVEVDYTKYKGHAISLAKSIALKNPDCIVACGGDGTINEIASCLVGTGINLGIIPVGSGNGLASNLGIPARMDEAFRIIVKGYTTAIDVGKVNDHFFFSNMGIGIDARIIRNYEQIGRRKLCAYVKAALTASLSFKPKSVIIRTNNETIPVVPYLLFISNSNEMGYSMSLTPGANLSDGLLNMVVIDKISLMNEILLGYRVWRNQVEKFKKARHSLITDVSLEVPDARIIDIQIDGEFHQLKTDTLHVSVIKMGLAVLT